MNNKYVKKTVLMHIRALQAEGKKMTTQEAALDANMPYSTYCTTLDWLRKNNEGTELNVIIRERIRK